MGRPSPIITHHRWVTMCRESILCGCIGLAWKWGTIYAIVSVNNVLWRWTACATVYIHPDTLPYWVPFSLGCLVQKDRNSPPLHPKKQKNESGEGEEAEGRYEYARDRVVPQSPGWPASLCHTAQIIGLGYQIQQGPCLFYLRHSRPWHYCCWL